MGMSCIREVAVSEPLVDTVNAAAMVSPGVPVVTVDLMSCTTADLSFAAGFTLTASRNDYVHALVGYFDICFTQGHTIIGFSTSPMSRYTHWKQTVFYLNHELAISAGECIICNIMCSPNDKNPRDLDIKIEYEWNGSTGNVKDFQEYRLR